MNSIESGIDAEVLVAESEGMVLRGYDSVRAGNMVRAAETILFGDQILIQPTWEQSDNASLEAVRSQLDELAMQQAATDGAPVHILIGE